MHPAPGGEEGTGPGGFLIGIDGGGTRTTLALADAAGRELLRREGPAGLVDPRDPAAAAGVLADLVRGALAQAGARGPALALCAGLAGAGGRRERGIVEEALAGAGIAERVVVCSDGEAALHGALSGGPGILLVAGTGSIAFARAEDGRVERCGGWGMVVGDEGSGYAIGRGALRAALRAADGRGERTRLLPALLEALGVESPDEVPPRAGRAAKSEIAALAAHVLRLAGEGDAVAGALLDRAAEALAEHASALLRRLGPWGGQVPVVLHGGVARQPAYAERVERVLRAAEPRLCVRPAEEDAAAGAVRLARELAGA